MISAVALTACSIIGWPGGPVASPFASNGERIYVTGTSESGGSLGYSGGPSGGMMDQRLSCATCHGPEGRGGSVTMMMQTFEAPNITWPELTAEHHEEGEMEHPPYTEQTVRRAITEGLNPAGQPLLPVMPRWSMTDRDLNDLVAYLQTLR